MSADRSPLPVENGTVIPQQDELLVSSFFRFRSTLPLERQQVLDQHLYRHTIETQRQRYVLQQQLQQQQQQRDQQAQLLLQQQHQHEQGLPYALVTSHTCEPSLRYHPLSMIQTDQYNARGKQLQQHSADQQIGNGNIDDMPPPLERVTSISRSTDSSTSSISISTVANDNDMNDTISPDDMNTHDDPKPDTDVDVDADVQNTTLTDMASLAAAMISNDNEQPTTTTTTSSLPSSTNMIDVDISTISISAASSSSTESIPPVRDTSSAAPAAGAIVQTSLDLLANLVEKHVDEVSVDDGVVQNANVEQRKEENEIVQGHAEERPQEEQKKDEDDKEGRLDHEEEEDEVEDKAAAAEAEDDDEKQPEDESVHEDEAELIFEDEDVEEDEMQHSPDYLDDPDNDKDNDNDDDVLIDTNSQTKAQTPSKKGVAGSSSRSPSPSVHHPPPVDPVENVWHVEKILDIRMTAHGKEFLVKWLGYDDKDNMWLIREQFTDGYDELIQTYWAERHKAINKGLQSKQAGSTETPDHPDTETTHHIHGDDNNAGDLEIETIEQDKEIASEKKEDMIVSSSLHSSELTHLMLKSDDDDNDQKTRCHVCGSAHELPDDRLFTCCICDVRVHQHCYFISPSLTPSSSWRCLWCAAHGNDHHRMTNNSLSAGIVEPEHPGQCVMCPIPGGALCRTNRPGLWAHVVCGSWASDNEKGILVDFDPESHILGDIDKIASSRLKLTCVFCRDRSRPYNAPIQCTWAMCHRPFHILCARKAGLPINYCITSLPLIDDIGLHPIHPDHTNLPLVARYVYCRKHQSKQFDVNSIENKVKQARDKIGKEKQLLLDKAERKRNSPGPLSNSPINMNIPRRQPTAIKRERKKKKEIRDRSSSSPSRTSPDRSEDENDVHEGHDDDSNLESTSSSNDEEMDQEEIDEEEKEEEEEKRKEPIKQRQKKDSTQSKEKVSLKKSSTKFLEIESMKPHHQSKAAVTVKREEPAAVKQQQKIPPIVPSSTASTSAFTSPVTPSAASRGIPKRAAIGNGSATATASPIRPTLKADLKIPCVVIIPKKSTTTPTTPTSVASAKSSLFIPITNNNSTISKTAPTATHRITTTTRTSTSQPSPSAATTSPPIDSRSAFLQQQCDHWCCILMKEFGIKGSRSQPRALSLLLNEVFDGNDVEWRKRISQKLMSSDINIMHGVLPNTLAKKWDAIKLQTVAANMGTLPPTDINGYLLSLQLVTALLLTLYHLYHDQPGYDKEKYPMITAAVKEIVDVAKNQLDDQHDHGDTDGNKIARQDPQSLWKTIQQKASTLLSAWKPVEEKSSPSASHLTPPSAVSHPRPYPLSPSAHAHMTLDEIPDDLDVEKQRYKQQHRAHVEAKQKEKDRERTNKSRPISTPLPYYQHDDGTVKPTVSSELEHTSMLERAKGYSLNKVKRTVNVTPIATSSSSSTTITTPVATPTNQNIHVRNSTIVPPTDTNENEKQVSVSSSSSVLVSAPAAAAPVVVDWTSLSSSVLPIAPPLVRRTSLTIQLPEQLPSAIKSIKSALSSTSIRVDTDEVKQTETSQNIDIDSKSPELPVTVTTMNGKPKKSVRWAEGAAFIEVYDPPRIVNWIDDNDSDGTTDTSTAPVAEAWEDRNQRRRLKRQQANEKSNAKKNKQQKTNNGSVISIVEDDEEEDMEDGEINEDISPAARVAATPMKNGVDSFAAISPARSNNELAASQTVATMSSTPFTVAATKPSTSTSTVPTPTTTTATPVVSSITTNPIKTISAATKRVFGFPQHDTTAASISMAGQPVVDKENNRPNNQSPLPSMSSHPSVPPLMPSLRSYKSKPSTLPLRPHLSYTYTQQQADHHHHHQQQQQRSLPAVPTIQTQTIPSTSSQLPFAYPPATFSIHPSVYVSSLSNVSPSPSPSRSRSPSPHFMRMDEHNPPSSIPRQPDPYGNTTTNPPRSQWTTVHPNTTLRDSPPYSQSHHQDYIDPNQSQDRSRELNDRERTKDLERRERGRVRERERLALQTPQDNRQSYYQQPTPSMNMNMNGINDDHQRREREREAEREKLRTERQGQQRLPQRDQEIYRKATYHMQSSSSSSSRDTNRHMGSSVSSAAPSMSSALCEYYMSSMGCQDRNCQNRHSRDM